MTQKVQVYVTSPGGPRGSLVVGDGFEVRDTGLDQLDPPLYWNAVLRGAFCTLTDRVEIVGLDHVGAFTKEDDFVQVEAKRGVLVARRLTTYVFSGWRPRR